MSNLTTDEAFCVIEHLDNQGLANGGSTVCYTTKVSDYLKMKYLCGYSVLQKHCTCYGYICLI